MTPSDKLRYHVTGSIERGENKAIVEKTAIWTNTEPRSLSAIAREIRNDWKNVYFGAVPYLNAMQSLDKVTDNYGADSGKSIVIYFLANASAWRGETARRIKAELKKMAGLK